MIPLRIEGATTIFKAPEGHPEVRDLHVLVTDGACISRWEPTADELAVLTAGGSVELWVLGHQPCVFIGVAPLAVEAL